MKAMAGNSVMLFPGNITVHLPRNPAIGDTYVVKDRAPFISNVPKEEEVAERLMGYSPFVRCVWDGDTWRVLSIS